MVLIGKSTPARRCVFGSGGFPMKDNDEKPKVNRRHFIGKMAGGILGVSVLPPGTAAPSAMGDADFDLDVRLTRSQSPQQKVAEGQASVRSCAVSCGGSCATCGSTCASTCGSSCGGTCRGTCVTCGGASCNPSCQGGCPPPTRGCPPPSPKR